MGFYRFYISKSTTYIDIITPLYRIHSERSTNIAAFKAGKIEQQYEYQSFLPNAINHSWVPSDPECLMLLDEASRLLGELNAFSQLIPDVDFFIRMHVTKEATTSSRMEGTQTNMHEALVDVGNGDPMTPFTG